MAVSKKIYVVGHKNPDTDSVASAIAYAQLLQLKGRSAHALVAGKLNKGTELALKTFKVKSPKHTHKADFVDASVILVDHNEEGQWPDGVTKDKVTRVVDHHRIGEDFSTDHPIFVRVEPVGATSTIVSKMYREVDLRPEIHVAGLLLSAILTDTLLLKSPTTTDDDREIAEWLNGFVKIDMKKHAEAIFAAKSDITGLSMINIIKKDFKEFHFNHNVKFGIAVFETLTPDLLFAKREALLARMKKFKQAEHLTHLIFVVTDIHKMCAYILPLGIKEEVIIEKIFGKKSKDGFIVLPGVVSRKKQLVPALEEYFKG